MENSIIQDDQISILSNITQKVKYFNTKQMADLRIYAEILEQQIRNRQSFYTPNYIVDLQTLLNKVNNPPHKVGIKGVIKIFKKIFKSDDNYKTFKLINNTKLFDNFKNDYFIGSFICKTETSGCGYKWENNKAQQNKQQMCIKCKKQIYPYYLEDLSEYALNIEKQIRKRDDFYSPGFKIIVNSIQTVKLPYNLTVKELLQMFVSIFKSQDEYETVQFVNNTQIVSTIKQKENFVYWGSFKCKTENSGCGNKWKKFVHQNKFLKCDQCNLDIYPYSLIVSLDRFKDIKKCALAIEYNLKCRGYTINQNITIGEIKKINMPHNINLIDMLKLFHYIFYSSDEYQSLYLLRKEKCQYNGRFHGYFYCYICSNEWKSYYAYLTDFEICECGTILYPNKLEYKEKKRKKNDSQIYLGPKIPHQSERCGKCLRLNKQCFKDISFNIIEPQDYKYLTGYNNQDLFENDDDNNSSFDQNYIIIKDL